MKKYVTAFLAALCLPMTLAAAPAPDPIADQILAANDAVQLATKNHDVKTLANLITDDYYLVSANGRVYDRASFLADAADTSVTYELNETEDAHVQHYNDNSAVLRAILHIRYRSGEKLVDVRIYINDVWVKLDGQWRYAAGQGTVIKAPPKTGS
jgi:hypothetical protein